MARSPEIIKKEAESAYYYCKEVYEGRLDSINGIENMVNSGIDEGSAKIYLNNFYKIRKGEVYKRAMNNDITNYFLDRINTEYNIKELENAVKAFGAWIVYYQNNKGVKLRKAVDILNKYKKIIADRKEYNSKI